MQGKNLKLNMKVKYIHDRYKSPKIDIEIHSKYMYIC